VSTQNSGGGSTPPVRALVALVALVAVVLAGFLALYAISPADQRPDVWAVLRNAWPSIVTGTLSMLAWLGVRRVSAQHSETAHTVDTIERRTNGELDQRMIDAARVAVRAELANITHPSMTTPPPASSPSSPSPWPGVGGS
jgi:hypothetical protein